MYRNIFISIDNTRMLVAFSVFINIDLRPKSIKPVGSYFDGNTILVISTTVAVSVTSDRFDRNT
jgi:hypothetical protein